MKVEGLVITQAGDDVLVYDQQSQSLHTLNSTVNDVWQHCDGFQTVSTIVAATGHSAEVVKRALGQLEDASLLESSLDDAQRSNESRRSFMKKAGLAAAIPAIVSVSVPLAKAAASHCVIQVQACSEQTDGLVCGESGGVCLTCQSFPGYNRLGFDQNGVPIYRQCGDNCPAGYWCEACPVNSTTPTAQCCYGNRYVCG